MLRTLTTVLLSAVCLIPASSWASTIAAPVLPQAVAVQSVDLPRGSTGGDTFGAFSLSYQPNAQSGAMAGSTSAYGGLDPSVSASAAFSGPPGSVGSSFLPLADSELVYYVEIAGPSGGPVPVLLIATGQATTSLGAVNAYAELTVLEYLSNGPLPSVYDALACAGDAAHAANQACASGSQSGRFDVRSTLLLTPNQIYEIVIEAAVNSYPLPDGAFSVSAAVDPRFELDPSTGGAYSVITSANLTQTPEPSGFVLSVTGAAAFAAFGLRRKLFVR